MKLAAEAKSNPKAIWKYIKSKTKTRVGVSELNTAPADPTSKLTTSDKEKAAQGSRTVFLECFYC